MWNKERERKMNTDNSNIGSMREVTTTKTFPRWYYFYLCLRIKCRNAHAVKKRSGKYHATPWNCISSDVPSTWVIASLTDKAEQEQRPICENARSRVRHENSEKNYSPTVDRKTVSFSVCIAELHAWNVRGKMVKFAQRNYRDSEEWKLCFCDTRLGNLISKEQLWMMYKKKKKKISANDCFIV